VTSGRLEGRRVVLVVAWAGLGGAERNALQVARHFAQAEGARVDVLAFTEESGAFRSAVEAARIPWHPHSLDWPALGKSGKVASLARLAWMLRRLRPDVLMPYCTRPNVLCGLVWETTGARICIWNQRDLLPSSRFRPSLIARAARRTPLLIANSRAAADHLVRVVGVPSERVRVIHDSVDIEAPQEDRASWRIQLGLSEDVFVTTMLAHLHRHKDHETMLRAWRRVLDGLGAGADAVLLLAGRSAGTEDAAKALAYDLELGRSVRFLGDVGDIGGLLSATDLGVLSSQSESYPNALLECMAAGLPVVGTDIAGIREVVGEHQFRYLASSGDSAGLASAIMSLYADEELRRSLGEENRLRVLDGQTVPAAQAIADLVVDALR